MGTHSMLRYVALLALVTVLCSTTYRAEAGYPVPCGCAGKPDHCGCGMHDPETSCTCVAPGCDCGGDGCDCPTLCGGGRACGGDKIPYSTEGECCGDERSVTGTCQRCPGFSAGCCLVTCSAKCPTGCPGDAGDALGCKACSNASGTTSCSKETCTSAAGCVGDCVGPGTYSAPGCDTCSNYGGGSKCQNDICSEGHTSAACGVGCGGAIGENGCAICSNAEDILGLPCAMSCGASNSGNRCCAHGPGQTTPGGGNGGVGDCANACVTGGPPTPCGGNLHACDNDKGQTYHDDCCANSGCSCCGDCVGSTSTACQQCPPNTVHSAQCTSLYPAGQSFHVGAANYFALRCDSGTTCCGHCDLGDYGVGGGCSP